MVEEYLSSEESPKKKATGWALKNKKIYTPYNNLGALARIWPLTFENCYSGVIFPLQNPSLGNLVAEGVTS
jgi:hypothetical protein